jgi:hypothetical protein
MQTKEHEGLTHWIYRWLAPLAAAEDAGSRQRRYSGGLYTGAQTGQLTPV